MLKASILIVTWNGDNLLKDCLTSLARVYGTEIETVVVDNANLESTRSLAAEFTNVKYIAAPDNLGFAGGNNLGLPLCTNEYIVLLNNDTRLTGDSISPLLEYLDSHPNCAAVQGTVVLASNPEKTDGTGLWWSPLGILAPEGFLTPLSESPQAPRDVFAVGGAFFATRRCAIAKAGGLFYDHFKSYYEEINLCHRFALAGYTCAYVPTIPILHCHSATANRMKRDDVLKQYYRNIWFSTLTCFGFYGLLRFVPTLAFLCSAQSIVALLRGRTAVLKSHFGNLIGLWREHKLILETRRDIRSRAVISDRKLFKTAVRSQPLSYYLNLVKHR